MAIFAPDTSCMVAKLVVTHEHHARAVAALDRHFDAGDTMVIVARGAIVVLRPEDYPLLLTDVAAAGTIGGQVYDASIAACARLAGADVLLTFNVQHFRRFEGDGLTIEVP